MRAKRFVPLAVAALLLVPALSASAHIDDFDIAHAFAHDLAPGVYNWSGAHGSLICNAGERYQVTVKITDDGFVGKGWEQGTCEDGTTSWGVTLTNTTGSGDGCAERIRGRAHTKIDGVPHDDATDVITNFGPGCSP